MSVEHNIPEPQPELRESAAAVSVSAATSNWPPRVNDCVLGLFEDGFYPCEVLSVTGDSAEITFMSPVTVKRSNVHWIWPSKRDIQTLSRDSILKVRPRLAVEYKLSTVRIVIFELLNIDVIKQFAMLIDILCLF